jgi:predicted lipoprotein with Yx(FWY)xxD motif
MAIYRGTRFGAFIGVMGLALAATLGLAACGAAGAAGGGYGGGTTTTTGGSSSAAGGVSLQCASGAAVCTKTVTVNGKAQTALADTKGMTLYYFTPDSATATTCTGSCAQLWPPLTATNDNLTGTGLAGALTTVDGANGNQVAYNGHPLYHYSGDTSQSDTKGEGLFGKWFVATNTLAAGAGAPASSTPTSGPGGGYGAGGY